MRSALPLLALLVVASSSAASWGEAAPILEKPDTRRSYWTLTLLGGGAFPIGNYRDDHELGLAARASLAYTSRTGLGAAISTGYSPLPAVDLGDDVRRENHVGHASLAPRFTLGNGTLRLFLGGGGGVVYERSTSQPRSNSEPKQTQTTTEAAAIAEAGIELHFANAGGLTLGGHYVYGVGDNKSQLAAAQAGFVLSF